MSNIFITSATGYIGEAVASALLESGHAVSALAYRDASAEKLEARGIKVYRGNLKDVATYKEALKLADVVIHT
ncbi:NmrA family NAD(P)-binding protein, partial [Acinetobacter baumannii]